MSANSRPSEPRTRDGVSDSGDSVSRVSHPQENDRRHRAAVVLRAARGAGAALRRSPDDLERSERLSYGAQTNLCRLVPRGPHRPAFPAMGVGGRRQRFVAAAQRVERRSPRLHAMRRRSRSPLAGRRATPLTRARGWSSGSSRDEGGTR